MGVKYEVNEDFFKKWTEEMAYTLGYFYADGSLENAAYIRGKYIRVSSVEKKNIEKIRDWLSSEHKIAIKKPTTANGKIGYLLRIGSHKLYDDLVALGLYPNKSLTIKFPDVPKKYLSHFVRGYFDGDGCIRIAMRKGTDQTMILSKLSSVFTSGSREFLQELATQLYGNAQTKQRNIYDGHRSYMLSYSTSDSVKLFKFMYGKSKREVCLKRKLAVYRKYFQMRPQRLDRKVKSVLQYLG